MPGKTPNKRTQEALNAAVSSVVSLQRCTSVPWSPSAVAAIEACPDGSVVAVARDNGSIELWDTEYWHCTTVIPGKDKSSINALTWTHDAVTERWRLFSAGLDGLLLEWDLRHLRPRCVSSSMGGAAWDIAAAPQPCAPTTPPLRTNEGASQPDAAAPLGGAGSDVLVAVATDDGAVRLMVSEAGGQGLEYRRMLGRAEARALCVAWGPGGSVVYAGYADGCIRAHAVDSGHEVLRITTATVVNGVPECIWSLAVLPNGCVTSGSSRGVVQVWEPQFGTLLSSSQQHQADVMCVAASPAGDRLFGAGVDPSLVMIAREAAGAGLGGTPAGDAEGADSGPNRFKYSDRKRPHTHDVRAMAVVTPPQGGGASFLFTGGNDAQLLVHSVESFERRHPVRVCRAPGVPLLRVALGASPAVVVAAAGHAADVWMVADVPSLHRKGKPLGEEGDPAAVAAPPIHLASLALPGPAHVAATAISHSGAFMAVSSPTQTLVFGIARDVDAAAAPAVRLARIALPADVPSALVMAFAQPAAAGVDDAGFALFLGDAEGRLRRVDVAAGGPGRVAVVHTFEASDRGEAFASAAPSARNQVEPAFSHLAASPCGARIAAVTPSGVHIFDLAAPPPRQHLGALPLTSGAGPVTAIAFSPDGAHLAVSTTDVKLQLFATAKLLPVPWLQHHATLPVKLDALAGSVVALAFRPAGGDLGSLVLATRTATCHVCLRSLRDGAPLAGEAGAKRARVKARPAGAAADAAGAAVRVMPLWGLCLGMAFVGPESLLLVEADWEAALKQLPPPLLLRQYGH